ncbi:MAG: hypothetical protein Q4C81_05475 [Kocuria sp.]|nr:hypothetical protein [Kocuria sp.]
MSTAARLALLAAGAAVGAVATRWAGSESVRRAFSGSTSSALEGRDPTDSRMVSTGQSGASEPMRENKWATRALRIAQDVRVAMNQREGELRQQLGLPSPENIRSRQALRSHTAHGDLPTGPEIN